MLFRSNDTATTEIYTPVNTLALHDALPIWQVAIVAGLEVGIAAAVTAGAANWWHVRVRRTAEPAAQPAAAAGRGIAVPRPGGAGRGAAPDGDDGHVIYLDRWATDHGADERTGQSGGPSALP